MPPSIHGPGPAAPTSRHWTEKDALPWSRDRLQGKCPALPDHMPPHTLVGGAINASIIIAYPCTRACTIDFFLSDSPRSL